MASISMASPVEAASSASTDGPASPWRAWVVVSTMRSFSVVAMVTSSIGSRARLRGTGYGSNASCGAMFRLSRPPRRSCAAHSKAACGTNRQQLTPLSETACRSLVVKFRSAILPVCPPVAFSEFAMAPRANWKGFLRLSLVTCPVALYPATSDTEKVSFNQINKKTGHRIKYAKVDADTGEEVANEDIIKGYKVDTDTYIEVTKEELDEVALESTHTIEIDEFVPKTAIDSRYLIRPYYLVPDGKVGHDAFAVVRETIRTMNKVAIGRVVLTNREHIIALEPLGK